MPETYRIIIMPQAADDLVKLCAYIEKESPAAASRVAQQLLNAIDSLASFPNRGKVHRSHRDPTRVVRSRRFT